MVSVFFLIVWSAFGKWEMGYVDDQLFSVDIVGNFIVEASWKCSWN
jgi:hypothetical protein